MVIREKRYTLAEFHEFSERAENSDRLFQLIGGKIVEKAGNFIPSQIAGWILTFINMYLLKNPIGYVTGADGSYVLSPDHEFMPDVGYISKESLPERPSRQVLRQPDLAVEVKSPTDSKRQTRLKAEDYLRFGTKLVWLVFPDEQRVEVYELDQDVVEIGINGVLDSGDLLPAFKLPVRDIFPE